MTVETKLTRSFEYLECFRPKCRPEAWHFVASGSWSESPYHTGHSLYQITKNNFLNTWVVISTDLPDEDDEEGEEGEHQQVKEKKQGKRKSSDEKDRNQTCFDLGEESPTPTVLDLSDSSVIAICRDAPNNATPEEMAKAIYEELWDVGLGLDE